LQKDDLELTKLAFSARLHGSE